LVTSVVFVIIKKRALHGPRSGSRGEPDLYSGAPITMESARVDGFFDPVATATRRPQAIGGRARRSPYLPRSRNRAAARPCVVDRPSTAQRGRGRAASSTMDPIAAFGAKCTAVRGTRPGVSRDRGGGSRASSPRPRDFAASSPHRRGEPLSTTPSTRRQCPTTRAGCRRRCSSRLPFPPQRTSLSRIEKHDIMTPPALHDTCAPRAQGRRVF